MDALFCYHIVLMLVATISFILLSIGFATPGWLVVTFQKAEARNEYTVSSLNRSLFYDILCPQELKDCKTCRAGDDSKQCVTDMGFVQYSQHYNWIELLTANTEEWVAWRVIMILVWVVCTVGFILVLCLVCCIFTTWVYRAIATTGFFLWLIAGLLVWVPVGMVAHMHLEIDDSVNDNVFFQGINHDSTLHIPYSVVLCGLGGFLALITALMLIWLTGICGKRDDRSDSRSETEIFSEQRPATMVPRENRYYGPYPYYPPERQMHYGPQQPAYYPRNGNNEVMVDDYPYYKGGAGGLGPNPWYDNRSAI